MPLTLFKLGYESLSIHLGWDLMLLYCSILHWKSHKAVLTICNHLPQDSLTLFVVLSLFFGDFAGEIETVASQF